MLSLRAELCDYPEYKELLQSYPSGSEDGRRGPCNYNPGGDKSVVATADYGLSSIKSNVE